MSLALIPIDSRHSMAPTTEAPPPAYTQHNAFASECLIHPSEAAPYRPKRAPTPCPQYTPGPAETYYGGKHKYFDAHFVEAKNQAVSPRRHRLHLRVTYIKARCKTILANLKKSFREHQQRILQSWEANKAVREEVDRLFVEDALWYQYSRMGSGFNVED
jgi:hypothetical protein